MIFKKREFQAGDRVIGRNKRSRCYKVPGTIVGFYDGGFERLIKVEFDQYIDGLSLGGLCEPGYGDYVSSKEIKHLRRRHDLVSEKELMKIINNK